MITMRILFLISTSLICQSLFSQVEIPKNDLTSLGDIDVAYSKIKNFNALPAGQKRIDDISYTDVQGSPFWENNWKAAIFILTNGGVAKAAKAKLNLYTNEVHFINDNIELACDNSQIQKIYFFNAKDTSKTEAVFESLPDLAAKSSVYYKVMNEGKFRLLKLTKVLLKENDYNAALGKKEYSFYSKVNYAVADGEKITPIKSLNKTGIFSAIPQAIENLDWLRINNNNLKNELDIIYFLIYLNAQVKK